MYDIIYSMHLLNHIFELEPVMLRVYVLIQISSSTAKKSFGFNVYFSLHSDGKFGL